MPIVTESRPGALAAFLFVAGSITTVQAQPTVGVTVYNPDSTYDGYTLFSPFSSDTTYLIDMWGRVVHAWDTDTPEAFNHAYLLEDGSLVKVQDGPGSDKMFGGGKAADLRKYDWNNTLLWDFSFNNDTARAHHDIESMPNGNVLMIAWEYKTEAEWVAQGGDASALDTNSVWPNQIVELEQTGATTAEMVWEWHMWDHLVQDFDAGKPNFGVVADNPQRIDVNAITFPDGDWAHTNGVDYNATLDQMALSTPRFNEVWIIDHSTTTAQAAGSNGGNSGMGGDLLYRWGNPRMYDQGSAADQKLFFQHDARWIPAGHPGAGNLLIFNNRNPGGPPGPDGDFSTVDELVTPDSGFLYKVPNPTYLPSDFTWSYQAQPDSTDFNGRALSGQQRLPNGNTLICNGSLGELFEVTASGNIVWRYKSPVTNSSGIVSQGTVVADFDNLLFKCDRYYFDYGAFTGRDLTPGSTIEPGTAQTAWLVSPADSALSQGTTPTFEWEAASNADTYHLQVSDSPTFEPGSLVLDASGLTGTMYTVTSKSAAVLPEGVYWWRVQSSHDTYGPGPMSDVRIFSTNEVLLPVELVAFRAEVTERNAVDLVWETASENANAGFQIEHKDPRGEFEAEVFISGAGTTTKPQTYRLSISDLEPGRHAFRLKQVDFDGAFEYYGPISVEIEAPTSIWLATPYPNPFNPRATVRFSVSVPGRVELNLYDMLGERVRTLYAGEPSGDGIVEVELDGSNLASGAYVMRLESASGRVVSRLALLSK